MKLSVKLRAIRKHRKMTLKEVSKSSGVSVSHISDIERGRSNPSVRVLYKLAETYRLEAWMILYKSEVVL